MAHDHARINLAIWGDDDFTELSPAAQHLYFVLWTSPGRSYCGSGTWHPGRISQLAGGWDSRQVELAGAELAGRLFVVIDDITGEYLLRSWVKHDGLWRTPNMAVSVAMARSELASKKLRGVVVHEVQKLANANPKSSSWDRPAVRDMLSQRAVDPGDLTPFVTPSLTPPATVPVTPPVTLGFSNANPWPNPTANPGSNPASTTATTTTTATSGGYVSGERYEANQPELADAPQPLTCSLHPDGTDKPCRGCANAREARAAAETADARRAAEARRAEREADADVKRAAIAECDLCDDRGYLGALVCSHDPGQADTNRRGSAAAREALAKRQAS